MQHRTVVSVRMLQAVSAVVSLAIIFWSLGLPTIRVADAENLTNLSNTLSDSDLSVLANHEITFTTPTGVAAGETVVVTFPTAFNISTSSVDFTDVDVASSTDYTVAADCTGTEELSVSITDQDLTITFCADEGSVLPANGTTTIEIGNNANGGDQQVTNPNTAGSYEFSITAGSSDSGNTLVAIIDDVDVSASVDTVFTFSVGGVAGSQSVNGTTTTGTSTATAIAFGKLTAGQATTTAQDLTVTTNASQGYVVTVAQSTNLRSSTGADIDGFADGAYTSTPTAWSFPSGDINDENTFGHWGLTTEDATTTRSTEFGSEEYISASSTPEVVMSHDGPADGATQGVGTARVGYTIAITSLQEAGDDYQTTLTYVATPTF